MNWVGEGRNDDHDGTTHGTMVAKRKSVDGDKTDVYQMEMVGRGKGAHHGRISSRPSCQHLLPSTFGGCSEYEQ